jgi:putative ABC transport system permease protein
MWKSFIKVGIRNLFRDKIYSVINVFGLATGLSAGILILVWVNNEYSVNCFHRKIDRIFQICITSKTDNRANTFTTIPAPVATYLKLNSGQITQVARVTDESDKQIIKCNGKQFVEGSIAYTENEFFHIFDFPIEEGNSTNPFPNGSSVVITRNTATRYYGDRDPIGQTLEFKGKPYVVAAVMKDFPENSSIHFDVLFSLDAVRADFTGNGQWKTIDEDWGDFDYTTYCLANRNANISGIATALSNELRKANPSPFSMKFTFLPFSNAYLYNPDGSKGRIIMVQVFFFIAIAILLLASFNYINLFVAKATQRMKDVTIRKLAGANKRQLILQFFTETGILVVFAVLLSMMMILTTFPIYKSLLGLQQFEIFGNWDLWKIVLITLAFTLLITGLYPAALLAASNPLQSLKNSNGLSGRGNNL